MLERDVELEYLSARLGGTRGGQGGVVAIEGPAGIGKSRLLAATVAVAGELGLGVLRARGGELEAALLAGGGGRRAVSS
jgi:predicted ATP-dependent serine protease